MGLLAGNMISVYQKDSWEKSLELEMCLEEGAELSRGGNKMELY